MRLREYLKAQGVLIKAVNNNDVSGGIFCGHTASGPGCPYYGNLDSIDLRIFSLGDVNSPNKQWARYIKLEYKEQLSNLVAVPTDLQIMENDDRIGRGGDHQAFTDIGYTAVRFTQANEDGDANSDSIGYTDRQHSLRDSLGRERRWSDRFYLYQPRLPRPQHACQREFPGHGGPGPRYHHPDGIALDGQYRTGQILARRRARLSRRDPVHDK